MARLRVLICGSRGWKDPAPINAILAGLDVLAEAAGEKLTVIHGAAPGADQLAGKLARQWGAEVTEEPAQWDKHGKAAGPIRNQLMLDEHDPEVVYAFRADGKSNGTDDMVRRAVKAEVPTYVITRAT
jgi:hypothetical protein